MSKLIPLTRDQFAIVDDHWFERLSQYTWQCTKDGYAAMLNKKHVYMHRLVAGTPKGLEADHINRNRLDNQEHNLRNVTHADNQKNRGPRNATRRELDTTHTKPRRVKHNSQKFPTISVSLNDERLLKLSEMLRALREQDETISRSEVIGRAIDHFHPVVCPSKSPSGTSSVQKEAA